MPPLAKRCCRSCPRCDDCPVRALAVARARREEDTLAALIGDAFTGGLGRGRELPEPVLRTLETLELARRGEPVGV